MQREKENHFHKLHHNGGLLILPNIWDVLGASLLQDIGYPAVATSSSAIALSNGYQDGEKLPFEDLLKILTRISQGVNIPVSADVETAYASNNTELKENIKKLIQTGIAGINFEDSGHNLTELTSIKKQCEKIEIIKDAAAEMGSRLFINARIDVYIKGEQLSDDEKLAEAIQRGRAYKNAGADGIYPIILKNKTHIETIVKETGLPVNVTMIPGIPDFETLKAIGVARVSLASGFLKSSVYAMKNIAEQLLKEEGMEESVKSMVSSDYLKSLISGNNQRVG